MNDKLKLVNLIKLLEKSMIDIETVFFMKDGDYRYPRIVSCGSDMRVINDGNFEEFYGQRGTIYTTVDIEAIKRILASNDFYHGLDYHDFYSLHYPVSNSKNTRNINDLSDNDTLWSINRDIYNLIIAFLEEFSNEDIHSYPPYLKDLVDKILNTYGPNELDFRPSRIVSFKITDLICSPVVSAIVAQYPYIDLYSKPSDSRTPNENFTRTFKGTNLHTVTGYILKDYGMKYMEVAKPLPHVRENMKYKGKYYKAVLKKNDDIDNEDVNYMKVRGYKKDLENVPNSMVLYPKAYQMSDEESDVYHKLNVNAHIIRYKKLIEVYGEDITLNDLQIIKNVYSKRKMESAYQISNMICSETLSDMILGLHEKTTEKNEISGEPVYRYPWNMYL